MDEKLDNYNTFVTRVDALCSGIVDALHEHVTCSEGCSSCCTAITIFPVEAAVLNNAIDALPAAEAATIRSNVASQATGERCPLLHHHRCLLYGARPIICRTHGLPILYTDNGQRHVDCCPLNLEQCESLPGSAIIDLEQLNTILVAINALYLSQAGLPADFPERLSIAEAILGQ